MSLISQEELLEIVESITGLSADQVPLDADIYDELNIDSFTAQRIVATVEVRLDIVLEEREVANVRTFEQFQRVVEVAMALKE